MDAGGNRDKRNGGNATRFHLEVKKKKKEEENAQIAKALRTGRPSREEASALISQTRGVGGDRVQVKVRLVRMRQTRVKKINK